MLAVLSDLDGWQPFINLIGPPTELLYITLLLAPYLMITKWLQATDDYKMFQLQVINHLLIYQIIASFNYD